MLLLLLLLLLFYAIAIVHTIHMPFAKQHGNDATSIMQLFCLLLWGLVTNFVL